MLRLTIFFLLSNFNFLLYAQSAQDLFQKEEKDSTQASEYYHKGRVDRVAKEECAKDESLLGCDMALLEGLSIDGNREQVVKIVSSAYTVVGPQMQITGSNGLLGGEADPSKKLNDFCSFIPTVGNEMAQDNENTMTEHMQKQAGSLSSPQSDALYRTARTHQNSAKNAKGLNKTWSATSYCYSAYIANGGFSDPKIFAKVGAAYVVADFYGDKKKVHEKYEDKLKKLGDYINSKNDCGPITNTHCFCNLEPSSSQFDADSYKKYCLPKGYAPRGFHATSCVDDLGRVDRNCDCSVNGNCFDKSFNMKLKDMHHIIHPTATPELSKAVADLTNGDSSKLSSQRSSALLNAALGTLKKYDKNVSIDPQILKRVNPNALKYYQDKGLPKNTSLLLASSSPASYETKKLFANQAKVFNAKETLKKFKNIDKSKMRYSKLYKKPRSRKKKRSKNMIAQFNNGNTKGGVSILGWEQKALNKADISIDNSKHLFEIISNRYKFSGWEKVKYDFLR